MANFNNISSASRNRDKKKKKKVDSSNPTLGQVLFSFDFGVFFFTAVQVTLPTQFL